MKKKVLVLWSGGIDSTAVLKMYLERTDYNIIALKIVYSTSSINVSERIQKELQAINLLLPHLLNIREFEYKFLTINNPNQCFGADVPIFGTLAIYPAQSFGATEIVIGFVSDVREEQMKYVLQKITKLNKIADLFYSDNKKYWKRKPTFVIPEFYNTKKKYILELGNLVSLCWFCRNPKEADNTNGCGHCHTCNHVKRILPQFIEI